MEDSMIRDHLAQAERHVRESDGHIVKQRSLIAELERDGHAKTAKQAKALLETMLEIHSTHVFDCARLKAELKRKVALKDAPVDGDDARNPEELIDAPRTDRAS
jgi:hypothetical protein